jgi:hypothetical protein
MKHIYWLVVNQAKKATFERTTTGTSQGRKRRRKLLQQKKQEQQEQSLHTAHNAVTRLQALARGFNTRQRLKVKCWSHDWWYIDNMFRSS